MFELKPKDHGIVFRVKIFPFIPVINGKLRGIFKNRLNRRPNPKHFRKKGRGLCTRKSEHYFR